MTATATTYSNARQYAYIEDWPSGNGRTVAEFEIETNPKRGQRPRRRTKDSAGNWCNWKVLPFSVRACIVDGADGKTHILRQLSFGAVEVFGGDLRFTERTIPEADPEHATLMQLLDQAEGER